MGFGPQILGCRFVGYVGYKIQGLGSRLGANGCLGTFFRVCRDAEDLPPGQAFGGSTNFSVGSENRATYK